MLSVVDFKGRAFGGEQSVFEAVIALCLELAGTPCRNQLLPGYEASTAAECEAALSARPPALVNLSALGTLETPMCRRAGEPLTMEEVADGVFVHKGQIAEPDRVNRGDVANLGFIVGEDSVAVIDTGGAPWVGEGLWRAIREHTSKPVSHVILTHLHPDHVFGTGPFAFLDAEIVAHVGLSRALADRQAIYLQSFEALIGNESLIGTNVPPVTMVIDKEMAIDLGNRPVVVKAWPVAHSLADVTVFDTSSGTLFAGDLIFHRHTPALDGRLMGWKAVLLEIETMDVAQIVPGHGGPVLDWPDGLADMKRYLMTLERDTRQAIADGERLGDAVNHIADSERRAWVLFQAYNKRNATIAFTELEWE
ncbi:MAG: quinoprotein relay system zinc metallohydrolase 2 [Pseudomonadota bacterium]